MKPTSSQGDTSLSHQAQLVAEHWARRLPSFDQALALLHSQGLDTDRLNPEDLHGLDMVHAGGVEATDLVAHEASIESGQHLLDVGCGLGGPARRFAYRHGAVVSGIELSEPVFQTAVALTSLVGLGDRVHFTLGSALKMPYEEGTFDVVVMQHCAMQVTEKHEIFGESARVLRPGGILVLHEFFSGTDGEPRYPLVWASEPACRHWSRSKIRRSCSVGLASPLGRSWIRYPPRFHFTLGWWLNWKKRWPMEPAFEERTWRRRVIAFESSVRCSRTSTRIACVLG